MSDDTSQLQKGSPAPAAADLGGLARLAREIGAPDVAAEADAVARRVAEGRFYVACVGQFKRGKSTLLNALVGRALLPVGVLPVTSVPTVLRFGDRIAARVRFRGGAWGTSKPASSPRTSPKTTTRRTGSASRPWRFSSRARCFPRASASSTRPGSGRSSPATRKRRARSCLTSTRRSSSSAPTRPFPARRWRSSRRSRCASRPSCSSSTRPPPAAAAESAEAARFAEAALKKRLGTRASPLLLVSATETLDAGPTRDWEKLERSLSLMARESGAELVRLAERRATSRLGARLVAILGERRDALERPLAESEGRIAALGESVAAAERSMADLGFLSERGGRKAREDVRRASGRVSRPQRGRGPRGPPKGNRRARFGLRWRAPGSRAERGDRPCAAAPRRLARRRGSCRRGALPRAAERFLSLGDEFLRRFLASGEVGPEALPPGLGHEAGFRAKSGLSTRSSSRSPSRPRLAARRPRCTRAARRRAVARDAAAYLERLLSTNSARVQNDLIDRVRESRQPARGRDPRAPFGGGPLRGERARLARARRAEGDASVAAELQRLRSGSRARGRRPRTPRDDPLRRTTCTAAIRSGAGLEVRERYNDVWQLVLSREGLAGGYEPAR